MVNKWILYAVAISLVLGGVSAFSYSSGYSAAEKRSAAAVAELTDRFERSRKAYQDQSDQATQEALQELGKEKALNESIGKDLDAALSKDPVYTSCRVTPNVVQIYNAAANTATR